MSGGENQSAECVDIDPFAIGESSVVADPLVIV